MIAQRADDEYIKQLADAGVDFNAKSEMTEDGYGPIEARLDNVVDSVNLLVAVTKKTHGDNKAKFEPVKRPTNAIEKYQERQRVSRHAELLDEVAKARERRRQRAQSTA